MTNEEADMLTSAAAAARGEDAQAGEKRANEDGDGGDESAKRAKKGDAIDVSMSSF